MRETEKVEGLRFPGAASGGVCDGETPNSSIRYLFGCSSNLNLPSCYSKFRANLLASTSRSAGTPRHSLSSLHGAGFRYPAAIIMSSCDKQGELGKSVSEMRIERFRTVVANLLGSGAPRGNSGAPRNSNMRISWKCRRERF